MTLHSQPNPNDRRPVAATCVASRGRSALAPLGFALPCFLMLGGGLLSMLSGCDSLATVDRNTDDALRRSADQIGDATALPRYDPSKYDEGSAFPKAQPNQNAPLTTNPALDSLEVPRRSPEDATTEKVIARFTAMADGDPTAQILTFEDAIRQAQLTASEYLTAEESYIITALRLLIEEHRWGPNFFNETSALFTGSSDNNGRYTTAITALNNFGVTQRLPYGGDVSARVLVTATEQLDNAIAGDSQSADIILAANIPLLRGAGLTAQEPLIQARRELIYAARTFQQFRRSFYFDLATNYLQLIFQEQQIGNAERQVQSSREVESRTSALVDSGRTEPFQADLARQNTLFAVDRLAQLKENYRLTVDLFKLRLGMDTTTPVRIAPRALELPMPAATLDEAVKLALDFRLDLQTESDRVEDFRRNVDVAKNALQGDLNLALNADIPTRGETARSGLQFRPNATDFIAGITYSMPLDRTSEESVYRQTQIRLEQQRRNFRQFRDRIAIEARQSVRAIEKSQFSLLISERNVETSLNRQNAIDAAPDRATARDRTEAVNNLQQAEDNLEQAKRDLQVAILRYLETTGQLRVSNDGNLMLPPGLASPAQQP